MTKEKGQSQIMSEQHIPQPNSQSAAPAEVFDSTADAPHGQTVSALGTPGPRPGEVVVHTGQKNSLDFSIDRQFIPIDTFIWSTTQPRGTLLWQSPVHPTRVNPLVAYISEIYNTWGGGIEFNFKVAGTGFHAGALAFVRVPPNRRPQQFATPTEWGAFEYVVMDPKTLEVLSLDVMDQRQLNFHFMKLDESDPTSFGGYIACYVLIPLNTSSTGTQQIAVQAFSRPGATFTMNQLIMPMVREPEVPKPIILERTLQYYPGLSFGSQTFMKMWALRTMEDTTQKALNCLMVSLDGDEQSVIRHTFAARSRAEGPIYAVSANPEPTPSQFRAYQTSKKGLVVPRKGDDSIVLNYTEMKSYTASAQTYTFTKYKLTTATTLILTVNYTSGSSALSSGNLISLNGQYSDQNDDISYAGFGDDDYFTISATNEVFLYYTNDTTPGDSTRDPMLFTFWQAAKEGIFKGIISKDECLFFDIIDKSTNTVLMTTKMYYEGFMTVHSKMANKSIAQPAFFAFNGYGLRTSSIPVTPAQLMATAVFTTAWNKTSSVADE